MCRPWKLGGTSAESQKWLSGPTAGLTPCLTRMTADTRGPLQARPRCSYRDQPRGSLDGRTRPRGLPLLLPLLGSCPRSASPGWSLGKDGCAPAETQACSHGHRRASPLGLARETVAAAGGPPHLASLSSEGRVPGCPRGPGTNHTHRPLERDQTRTGPSVDFTRGPRLVPAGAGRGGGEGEEPSGSEWPPDHRERPQT